jgi:hypothetical protein
VIAVQPAAKVKPVVTKLEPAPKPATPAVVEVAVAKAPEPVAVPKATLSVVAAVVTPAAPLPVAPKVADAAASLAEKSTWNTKLVASTPVPAPPPVVVAAVEPTDEADISASQVAPETTASITTIKRTKVARAPQRTRKAVAAAPPRKAVIAIVQKPQKKKYARKSSGSETRYAFGGPSRRRHVQSPTSWFTALFSGQMFVSSNRFVARPAIRQQRRAPAPVYRGGGSGFSGGGGGNLEIVLSNH